MNFLPIIYDGKKSIKVLHTKDINTVSYVVNIDTYPFAFKA